MSIQKNIMQVIKHMLFMKIERSNIHKIMASLDEQKISLKSCLLANLSLKLTVKTLKIGQNVA